MKYRKCPICDLNYITEDQIACDVCMKNRLPNRPPQPIFDRKNNILFPQIIYSKRFYFVFQGNSYEEECRNSYIFAPKTGAHHWERLADICPDDIILHAAKGFIIAISAAATSGYDFRRSDYDGIGRRVDCKYCMLRCPLDTSKYIKEILAYPNDYSPFNKNGTGNQGYLFEINNTLASIFVDEILKTNPQLSGQIKNLCKIADA